MNKTIKIFVLFLLFSTLSFSAYGYNIPYLLSAKKMFFIDENYYAVRESYAEVANLEQFTKDICKYHDSTSGKKFKGKVYLVNVESGKIISIYNSTLDIYQEYKFWR